MNVSDRRVSLNPWRYVLMAGFAVFAANSALAQTSVGVPASPSGDSAPPLEEIVVTGSHVAKTALEQDVPIVSLSGLSIQKTGISNLADSLNQLPQFGSAGLSNTNTNFADDGAGVSTIELRNLGEPRTLVLIDGVRAVSGAPIGQGGPEYAVDVGTIPAFLIDHVDIVTGGGSASYGSEAVAGVVNIVLRDHYEGIMAQEEYGLTTEYGDSKTETFDLLAGTSFADEAGHVVFGLEYQDQGAVYSKDRPFAAKDTSVGGVYGPSSYNLGGNFGVGPGETGLVTDLGGNNIVPYNSQLYGVNREFYRTIQIPTDRLSLYEKASYDITPDITYFVNARFARTTATQQLEPIAIGPTTTIGYNGQTLVLPLNNAFVPPALAALGPTDDGNGNFADWRRRFVELGDRGADTTRTSYSVISGFKGDIDDRFKWETLFSYGETDSFQYQANSGNVIKLQEELNGCPSGGADGCVPINIFGPGSISQAAINYFKAPKFYDDQVTQTVVDADINGPIYTLPYGDIRLAVGFEYRREDGYNRPDALTAAGDGIDTQNPASGGEYDIREYYTELEVPVLKDIDYAKSLSIEGSWRYSDYSDVGGKQSYRYGITYAPVEDVLFRAVNSVAIRAPNLSELYQGRSQSAISVVDPCSNLGLATASNLAVRTANCRSFGVVPGFVENLNNQQSEITYTEGNTSLTNERAEVFTYGLTLQPRWIPGFNMTVDAFKYKIANAITSIDQQTAADQCADTLAPEFCSLVRRNAPNAAINPGLIQGVDQKVINVGSTDERGIDTQVTWGDTLDHLTGLTVPDEYGGSGRLDFTWNYEYLQQLEYTTINGSTTNQRGLFGAPHNRWNFNAVYSNDLFEFTWRLRYIGSQDFAEGGLDGPSIQPYVYNDIRVDIHINDWITPYVGVNNLLNQQPPLVTQEYQQTGAGVTSAVTGTNTVPTVYDAIGRFVYFGVKFEMPFSKGEAETSTYTPPPIQAPVAPPPPSVAHSYMVFFDFNKSDLTSDAVRIVDQAAKNAAPAKATELVVTGHTDTVGSDAYNMRLSRRRAESVAAELEKQGIASSEIEIVAKGKRDLLVPTGDGVREPQNRRVTIVYGGNTTS